MLIGTKNFMFKIQLIFFRYLFFLFNIGYPFGVLLWTKKKDKYLNIFNEIKNKEFENINLYEKKKKFKINKNWLDSLALNTQVVIKETQINYQHGRVLYSELSEYLINKNQNLNILETGTARGFSSICMAKALDDRKKKGKIFTIDILPHKKKIIWNCINDFNGKSSREELLKNWSNLLGYIDFKEGRSKKILNTLNLDRVHFAFLDGAHNKKTVEYEFKWVSDRQLKNDIIIFDDYDISKFDGIYELVNKIEKEQIYAIQKVKSDKNRAYAIAHKL